jgi:hypothetical protein
MVRNLQLRDGIRITTAGRYAMRTETGTYREEATRRRPSRRPGRHVVREGITVGLIGAAVAMVLFLVVDLAAGVPLRTPAMLGATLFHGARGAGEVVITTPVVLGYTAVHLGAFVLFGLALSGLFALAEREKRVLGLIFILGCCLGVVFVALVYGLAQWMREAMTPWVFFSGHLLAGLAVVAALVYFHRRLIRQFPSSVE